MKVADWPTETVRFAGCCVIAGAWLPVKAMRTHDAAPIRARGSTGCRRPTFRSTGDAMPVANVLDVTPWLSSSW